MFSEEKHIMTNINIYSKEEVLKHNKINDCWIIVQNKVYDITAFVKKHPGGSDILMTRAGENATSFFVTKHGLDKNIIKRLEKFQIGVLNATDWVHIDDLDEPFLKELLEIVKRENLYKISKRDKVKYTLFRVFMVFTFFSLSLVTIYANLNVFLSIAFILFQAIIGVSLFGFLAHEATHRNFPKNKVLKYLLEFIWPILWPFISKRPLVYEHNSHHIKIGDEEYDFEVAAFSDFIKYSATVKTKPLHQYQHKLAKFLYPFYANIITTLGGIKSNFWKIHDRKVALYHSLSLVVTFSYFIIIPTLISGFSLKLVLYYLLYQSKLFTGIYIGAAINHFVPSAFKEIPEVYQNKYAYYICSNTTNFGKNSNFYFFLTGGFNIQIEHHLIPFVPVENLKKLSLIVEDLCKKYDYPYINYNELIELWRNHYSYLERILNKSDADMEYNNKNKYQAR